MAIDLSLLPEVSRECCWADTISKYCCTVPKTCLVYSKKGVKMTLVCTQGERLRPLPPTSPRSGPFVDGFPLHTLIFELIDFEGLVWVRLALLRRGIFICGPSASPSSTALRPALSDRRQALSEGTDHYRDGARIIERSDQERTQTSSGR